jgi:E3 ubiquitin-protein ligase MARCH6
MVIAVWLGCLPYIIRQIWRLLFWFSDGGWPTNAVLHLEQNSTGMGVLRELQLASLAENGTSPVSPLQASPTTPASIAGVVDILIGLFTPVSQTLNISSADPLAAGLFESLAYGFGMQPTTTDSSSLQRLGDVSVTPRYSSLLSEVSFLRNLTRHPSINQLVITIAEGYIITILVVVCFILVFLIREWVVQQQPGINMGAGFNAEFAAAERPREQPANEAAQNVPAGEENQPEQREAGPRPMARIRRRNNQQGQGDAAREPQNPPTSNELEDTRLDAGSPSNRPVSVRDALSPAAEIQRGLTEEPRMTEEFLAIWRRADSDPREVLRIIERENKGDQMRYWVNAMRILQNPSSQAHDSGSRPPIQIHPPTSEAGISGAVLNSSVSSSSESLEAHLGSDESASSSGSWIDIHETPQPSIDEFSNSEHHPSSGTGDLTEESLGKGKNIASEHNQAGWLGAADAADASNSLWSARAANSLVPGTTRPRATSDGPPRRQIISPLAHNNWSFSNLPVDGDTSSNKENQSPANSVSKSPSRLTDDILWSNSTAASNELSKGSDTQDLNEYKDEIVNGLLPEENIEPEGRPGAGIEVEDSPIEIIGQDGVVRTHQNWDEVFEDNPISDSDSDSDEEAEDNQFHPDTPLPQPQEPVLARPVEPRGIFGTVADFLWGGLGDDHLQDEPGVNDEHIVEDLAAEPPFVPIAHQPPLQLAGNLGEQDREVAEAAVAAGLDPNDPDAIDDAEDFEGIMELVGMRGPIFSLIQNALFSAFLLALTVAFGVWIPYNIGRVSLLLLANPGPAFKLPLKLVFGCAAFMQDLGLTLAGVFSWFLFSVILLPINLWSYYSTRMTSTIALGGIELGPAALNISQSAFNRILDGTLTSIIHMTDSEIFAFSAASHESLIMLRSLVIDTLTSVGATVRYIFQGNYNITMNDFTEGALQIFSSAWQLGAAIPSFLARPESWVISLEIGKRPSPLDLELSVWDGTDRFWAIVTGYTVLCLLGALYVKKGTPFSSGQVGREWEATVIDLLNQAGGVMKVILIISIEMLVFPLYCGLLLDAALLPLFENTTIMSRLLFTFKSPLTSIFVHWFVGTCYMFHFALFVSMCRKIMRKGVLCKFSFQASWITAD